MNWAYITCKNPTNRDEVPVCKKTVQNSESLDSVIRMNPPSNSTPSIAVNNKVVVKRSCGVESVRDGAEGECDKFASSPSFVKTVDCSTCRVDGCNGEISTDYGSLAKDFPPEELKHLIKAKEPEVIGEDDVEDDDMSDDDNNIGRDAAERGNLVTKPEHHPTEAVPHAKDPEANAAEQRSVYTAMSLISVALLANYFSH